MIFSFVTGILCFLRMLTTIPESVDRGATQFLSAQTAQTLEQLLPGSFDVTKGIVSVAVIKQTCPTEQGAVLDFTPRPDGGAGRLVYISSEGYPTANLTEAQADAFPSAAAYNLDVGQDVTFTVKAPPGCVVAPFPVNDGSGLVYQSATIKAPAGGSLGFIRVFLNKA